MRFGGATMKRFLSTNVVILSLLASLAVSPVHGDTPTELGRNILGLEKRLWKARAERDVATLEMYLTDDYRSVVAQGRSTKTEFLEGLEGCDVRSYALSDFDLVVVNKDAVLLTYTAERDATCNGKPLPSHVMSTALFVLRDDHWRSAFYAESALAP
jgi:hypothetical protein